MPHATASCSYNRSIASTGILNVYAVPISRSVFGVEKIHVRAKSPLVLDIVTHISQTWVFACNEEGRRIPGIAAMVMSSSEINVQITVYVGS
jgi:hypothetical protein